jgi:DNA repair protein RecO (recombination protein O)
MSDRPRLYPAEVLILRRRDLGEADSIFTCYGEPAGKLDVIAKGVRKAKSRMGGHLEPLSIVRMLIARGRNLDVVTQVETVEPHRHLRDDLDRMYAGIYVADVVDSATADGLAHQGLDPLARAALAGLDAGVSIDTVLVWFETRLLTVLGHELQIGRCVGCDDPLAEAPTFLAMKAGGLVCANCRRDAGSGRMVSVRAIKVIRYGRTAPLHEFARLRLDGQLAAELRRVLDEALIYVLEREPPSRRYLEAALSGSAKP